MNAHNLLGGRKHQNNYNSGMFDSRIGDIRERDRQRSVTGGVHTNRHTNPVLVSGAVRESPPTHPDDEWQMRPPPQSNNDINSVDYHGNQNTSNMVSSEDYTYNGRNRDSTAYERNYPSSNFNDVPTSGRYQRAPLSQPAVSGVMDTIDSSSGAESEWKLLPPKTNENRTTRYHDMPPRQNATMIPTQSNNIQNGYKPLTPSEMSLDPVHRAMQIRDAMMHSRHRSESYGSGSYDGNGNYVQERKQNTEESSNSRRNSVQDDDDSYFDEDNESFVIPNTAQWRNSSTTTLLDQYDDQYHHPSHSSKHDVKTRMTYDFRIDTEIPENDEHDNYPTEVHNGPIGGEDERLMTNNNGQMAELLEDFPDRDTSDVRRNDDDSAHLYSHGDRRNRNVDEEGIRINSDLNSTYHRGLEQHNIHIDGDLNDRPQHPNCYDDHPRHFDTRTNGEVEGLQVENREFESYHKTVGGDNMDNTSDISDDDFDENDFSNYDRNPDEEWKLCSTKENVRELGQDFRNQSNGFKGQNSAFPSQSGGESNIGLGKVDHDQMEGNGDRDNDKRGGGGSLNDRLGPPTNYNRKAETSQDNVAVKHDERYRDSIVTEGVQDSSKLEGRVVVSPQGDRSSHSLDPKSIPHSDMRGVKSVGGSGHSLGSEPTPGRRRSFTSIPDKMPKESELLETGGEKTKDSNQKLDRNVNPDNLPSRQIARNIPITASKDRTKEADIGLPRNNQRPRSSNPNNLNLHRNEPSDKQNPDSRIPRRVPDSISQNGSGTNRRTSASNQNQGQKNIQGGSLQNKDSEENAQNSGKSHVITNASINGSSQNSAMIGSTSKVRSNGQSSTNESGIKSTSINDPVIKPPNAVDPSVVEVQKEAPSRYVDRNIGGMLAKDNAFKPQTLSTSNVEQKSANVKTTQEQSVQNIKPNIGGRMTNPIPSSTNIKNPHDLSRQDKKSNTEDRATNPSSLSTNTKGKSKVSIEDFNLDLPMTLSRKVRKSKTRLDKINKSSESSNRSDGKSGFNGTRNSSFPDLRNMKEMSSSNGLRNSSTSDSRNMNETPRTSGPIHVIEGSRNAQRNNTGSGGPNFPSDETIFSVEDSIDASNNFNPNTLHEAPRSNIPRRRTEPYQHRSDISEKIPVKRRGTAPHSYEASGQISSSRRNGSQTAPSEQIPSRRRNGSQAGPHSYSYDVSEQDSSSRRNVSQSMEANLDPRQSLKKDLSSTTVLPQPQDVESSDLPRDGISRMHATRRSTEPQMRSLEAQNIKSELPSSRRSSDPYSFVHEQSYPDRNRRSTRSSSRRKYQSTNRMEPLLDRSSHTTGRIMDRSSHSKRMEPFLDRSAHTTGQASDRRQRSMDMSGKPSNMRRTSHPQAQMSSAEQNSKYRKSPVNDAPSKNEEISMVKEKEGDREFTVLESQRASEKRSGASSKNIRPKGRSKGGKQRPFEPKFVDAPYGRTGAKYINSPSKNALANIYINLDSWLEHCREPLAIQKLMKRRQRLNPNRRKIKNEDYIDFKGGMRKLIISERDDAEREHKVLFDKSASKYKEQQPNQTSCIVLASSQMASMRSDMITEEDKFRIKKKKSNGKDGDGLESAFLSHQSFPKDIFKVISLLHGNDRCADCTKRFQDRAGLWANVTFGCLLCKECAFRHVSNEKKIKHSEVLKPINDGSWKFPEILSMVEGGNGAFIKHLNGKNEKQKGKRKNSVFPVDTDIDEDTFRDVYCGNAASTYRKSLSKRVEKQLLATS